MIRFLFVLLVVLLGTRPVMAQSIQSLAMEFRRTVVSQTEEDSSRGTVYYRAPNCIVLKVVEPLEQWMMLQDTLLQIYYPAERRAFHMTSEHAFTLPFLQVFIGLARDEVGFNKVGFTLDKNEVRGDTLITYWNPPEAARKGFGPALVYYAGDRLIRLEMRTAKGKLFSRTTFANHVPYAGVFFPLLVMAELFEEDSRVSEKVEFSHPQFNVELPQEVTGFQIPADIEAEEVRW